jgi:hypothetical protein
MASLANSRTRFMESVKGQEIKAALLKMEADERFNTQRGYTNIESSELDNTSFTDKHMSYLSQHLYVNPDHYLSNLRFMTKSRSK